MRVTVGKTVEPVGKNGAAVQIVQVQTGAEFPEKMRMFLNSMTDAVNPGEYVLDVSRAARVESYQILRDGKVRNVALLTVTVRSEFLKPVAQSTKAAA